MPREISDLTPEVLMGYNSIWCPQGIGDLMWIYCKLVGVGKEFDIVIPTAGSKKIVGGGKQELVFKRAHSIADIAPKIKSVQHINVSFWCDSMAYEISPSTLWLQANSWLEDGKRLENLWPALSTDFSPSLDIPDSDFSYDVIFYTSSTKGNIQWDGWQPAQWEELSYYLGKDCSIGVVGAEWDREYLEILRMELGDNAQFHIGVPLPEVLGMIKNTKILVGFPSGIPILSTILTVPTVMFYPDVLKDMPGTWVSPDNKNHFSLMYNKEESSPENVIGIMEEYL